jgi:hypothetical protein
MCLPAAVVIYGSDFRSFVAGGTDFFKTLFPVQGF